MNIVVATVLVSGLDAEGNAMSKIDQLKAEIANLPTDEFAEICRWLSEKDWEKWDRQIEADSRSGNLDFLVCEAQEEKAKGTLKDL
jgi:wyosine [tRNA(Phe)-imidazoG37] synthetase (radical SAM superfamily)